MLKWPSRARAAIRKLYEPLQDVDVYIEDLDDEAFYRALLKHATQDKVRIARVFSLGGRDAVIQAAESYGDNRRALFIIDGDLKWVRGDSQKLVPFLYQHDAYCVENLLLCERAVTTIVSQELDQTEPAAAGALQFANWIGSVTGPLLELFAAFATANKLVPSLATVSTGVGNLCSVDPTRRTSLDISKVSMAKNKTLAAAVAASSVHDATALYQAVEARIKGLPDPLAAISGKDFILPLLSFHLQSIGCRLRNHSLRMRLASAGDHQRFTGLATAVERAALGIT